MAEKSEKRKCLYFGDCCSYNHGFAANFDIIKSRRLNGIKVGSIFGIIMYVDQYGGRETGSSYNFWPVAGRKWFQMLLLCFLGSPSQCNIACPVISSKSMWNSTWQPPYNGDCFRFVGRHLELLVMSYHRQCCGMLLWSVLSPELLKTAWEYEA